MPSYKMESIAFVTRDPIDDRMCEIYTYKTESVNHWHSEQICPKHESMWFIDVLFDLGIDVNTLFIRTTIFLRVSIKIALQMTLPNFNLICLHKIMNHLTVLLDAIDTQKFSEYSLSAQVIAINRPFGGTPVFGLKIGYWSRILAWFSDSFTQHLWHFLHSYPPGWLFLAIYLWHIFVAVNVTIGTVIGHESSWYFTAIHFRNFLDMKIFFSSDKFKLRIVD